MAHRVCADLDQTAVRKLLHLGSAHTPVLGPGALCDARLAPELRKCADPLLGVQWVKQTPQFEVEPLALVGRRLGDVPTGKVPRFGIVELPA